MSHNGYRDAKPSSLIGLARSIARHALPKVPSVPITLSMLAHAGVVAVAAHRMVNVTRTMSPALAANEILVPELIQTDTPETSPTNTAVNVADKVVPAAAVRAPFRDRPATLRVVEEPGGIADIATRTDDTGPRFAMTVAPTTALASGSSAEGGVGANMVTDSYGPIAESAVETPAKLKSGHAPIYTAAALSAGVEADVPLEIVVNEQGVVVSARATIRVGYGLDEAAIQSVRGYRFAPASRGGKPVPVRMRWLMRFQLG